MELPPVAPYSETPILEWMGNHMGRLELMVYWLLVVMVLSLCLEVFRAVRGSAS